MKKIRFAIVGCGNRGNVYAEYALAYPQEAEIVAAVDVDSVHLKETARKFSLSNEYVFGNLDDFLKAKIHCDAIINATMDSQHIETATKLIKAGYHQLLEKPITNNDDEVIALKELAEEYKVSIVVCHVLRYTAFYKAIKRLLLANEIGKIFTMEMNEHVAVGHFADSFIRGKWGDEDKCGSPLLLQKCCHDLDLMCWLNGTTQPKAVHSFGQRAYFVPQNAPEDATEYCYLCPHNKVCSYSAQKLNIEVDALPFQTWERLNKPLNEITPQDKTEFLKVDDYGKCVYFLKRNLVDRQVVSVNFENGSLGMLTVVGGCAIPGRYIHIIGEYGEIEGHFEEKKFVLRKHVAAEHGYVLQEKVIDLAEELKVDDSGHGGGDFAIMRDYVQFLNGDNTSICITSIEDSVNGHRCVFLAEKSRKTGSVERF